MILAAKIYHEEGGHARDNAYTHARFARGTKHGVAGIAKDQHDATIVAVQLSTPRTRRSATTAHAVRIIPRTIPNARLDLVTILARHYGGNRRILGNLLLLHNRTHNRICLLSFLWFPHLRLTLVVPLLFVLSMMPSSRKGPRAVVENLIISFSFSH